MTETLTLDQAFHTLEEKLETSGVQETTARRYAQEFVEELQAGRSLSFADVGELRWQGDHVVLVKDLQSHQAVTERQPFRDVSASESSEPSEALTVRREASVRRLMEGGYSRDEALTALRTAEKYLDR